MTADAVSAIPITAAPHPITSAASAWPNCCRSVATVASTIGHPSHEKRRQSVHRLPPHHPNYRTNDFTRLYTKIVSATPMTTTPHATMSPLTLVIVVVVAASTGNTCAMASCAISASPSTATLTFFHIVPHPLSLNSPKQQLHDHTDRKASQEKRARPVHQGIDCRLIHHAPF